MDEMKLLEEFCAAEPEPHPGWLARTRSDLATSIGTAGQDAATRARGHWWSRLPARPRRTATIPRSHAARGWFTPLAAAVAVVVAVAVPLTVFHGPGLRPAHRTQAATAAGPAGTPTYYMATPGRGDYAVVASTATGQALAKVTVPGMELTVYSAAANDTTFLVGEFNPKGRFPSGFVLARFHPQTQAITLTPVALRPATVPGSLFWYTLSPDAAKVAISRYTIDGQRGVSVTIVTLATGVSRIWTLPFALDPQTTASTWSADSQRFEVTWQNSPSLTEYTSQVSLATPGSRLPRPRALTLPAGLRPYVLSQWAAANGDLFFVDSSYQAPAWRLVSYSAQTGEFSNLLGPVRATTQPLVAWSSGNGQVLIIYGHDGGLGALSDGHYTPLPFTGLARQPQASLVW